MSRSRSRSSDGAREFWRAFWASVRLGQTEFTDAELEGMAVPPRMWDKIRTGATAVERERGGLAHDLADEYEEWSLHAAGSDWVPSRDGPSPADLAALDPIELANAVVPRGF